MKPKERRKRNEELDAGRDTKDGLEDTERKERLKMHFRMEGGERQEEGNLRESPQRRRQRNENNERGN